MTSVNRMHIQGAGAFVQRARAVLMLTQCGNSTDRLLTMAKENDVADDFKEQGLVIQFDRELKEYSSEGKRAPLGIARPDTGRDLDEVFQEDEVELKSKVLVPRFMKMYSIQERQAKELLKRLTQVRHGVYRRTNGESAAQ